MKGEILVIEDDQDMCNMLKDGLGRRGYAVSTFTSGLEGLLAVQTQLTDVVLADISLPGGDWLPVHPDVHAAGRQYLIGLRGIFGVPDPDLEVDPFIDRHFRQR